MMTWQKESMSLMNIHRKWNELEPDAMEAGLPSSSRDAFEQALDRLTLSINEQKLQDSFMAAIDLYQRYTSGLSQVYTLSTPPEFYQVQYQTMAAIAAARNQDWTVASDSIAGVDEPWGLFKAQVKQADKKLLRRSEFSLQDLQQAVNSQDLNLVTIKGEIVMNNLKALEKALSSSSGGQGQ